MNEDEVLNRIGRALSIRMGITMSFLLSVVGNVVSRHFNITGFTASFLLSTGVSLVIGFLLPVGKIGIATCNKLGLKRGSVLGRYVLSLVATMIYAPVLTFTMAGVTYAIALKRTGGLIWIPFWQILLLSFAITFVCGHLLDFFLMPVFLKRLLKKYGVKANVD